MKNLSISFMLALTICGLRNAYAFDHSHLSFQKVLDQFVKKNDSQALVNYKNLKLSPLRLNDYLDQLQAIKKNEFKSWSKSQQLSLLINAYNAFTLKLIIDHYPVASIKDIGTLLKSPWKIEFFKWLGEDTSLDQLEHDVIRKNYQEPRIHFALVCASIGCPSLSSKVFISESLDGQLETASFDFLKDINKNRIVSTKPIKLELSSIFKWYGSDFKNLNQFLSLRITDDNNLKTLINQGNYDITFLDYDWKLNSL